jgi:hypothetical protein
MLGGGATDLGRSTENEPELDAETARCPPLGVAVFVAVAAREAGGGIDTGRVVVGGVEEVAGGGMLGAFGNGALASADVVATDAVTDGEDE